MSTLSSAREEYLRQRPFYQELSSEVRARLETASRHEGIDASVTSRAKDVSQVLRKLIKKPRPLEAVPDLAGVRVCVLIPDDIGRIRECIERLFVIHKFEDKRVQLSPTELGYYGQHFDVSLKPDDSAGVSPAALGLHCEIQVHTRAHNLWAELSHDLTYKSPAKLPREVIGRIYRIVALLDLVDSEIQASRDAALKAPGFEEGAMLITLERYYFELTGRPHDAELSLYIVAGLKNLYDERERRGFEGHINEFVKSHRERFEKRYEQYQADDRASPLLFQPEALMIVDRLEANGFALKEAWERILPLDLLEDLANVWGVPL